MSTGGEPASTGFSEEATMEACGERDEEMQVQLDRSGGRTAVVVPGEELSPGDHAGWTTQRRKPQQRRAEAPRSPPSTGKPAAKANASLQSKEKFVKKVNASMSRAARMPNSIPREEHKIIIRPRGGLQVGKVRPTELATAIMVATGIARETAMQDTVCLNVAQNIIIVSTPAEERISKYARIEALTIGSREYEVYAYQAAPNGTVKGVIRNISTEDTQEEIIENIVNDYNPTAIDARRIGKSSAIVVLFQGEKVPTTVKYGSVLVRCSLYRQHREVCKCCGGVGHRQDVCPQPEKNVCFACGKQNPSENHAETCKPRCKLCGGAHPTGAASCSNRFKTPYLVRRRQWSRQQTKDASSARKEISRSEGEFPPLLQQRGRSGSKKREQRPGNRSASRGARDRSQSAARKTRGKSGDRPSRATSQSREHVMWAEIAGAPKGRRRSRSPRQRREMLQPRDERVDRLQEQVAALKAENASLSQKLERAIKLLESSGREQEPRGGAMTRSEERRPEQPARPAQKEEEAEPPTKMKALQKREGQSDAVETETEMDEDQDPPCGEEGIQGAQKQRLVSWELRLRRCAGRISRLEKRMDAFEANVNARLDKIQEYLHRMLDGDEVTPGQYVQANQPTPNHGQ